jgi:hypothetical protein
LIQRYGVTRLNKKGIFLMIKELILADVNVRLWVGPLAAPISTHQSRELRQHPHRKEEFDLVAALIPHPWTWDDIAKDPLGKPRLKNTALLGQIFLLVSTFKLRIRVFLKLEQNTATQANWLF